MPELPEVEIARENLERWLKQRTVVRAKVFDSRMTRGGGSPRTVALALKGARLGRARRRAKILLLDFETANGAEKTVFAHLAMSGKFVHRAPGETDGLSVAAALWLEDESRVIFSNPRRLGHFRLLTPADREKIAGLGIEPLDKAFTSRYLFELLKASRRPSKLFLMDQQCIAGIGNIQAAEALFAAQIHPTARTDRLTWEQAKALRRAILRTIRDTFKRTRAEEVRYVRERDGGNPFLVYGKERLPCPRCGTAIGRFVQGGRSSFFCPSCQPDQPDRLE